MAELADAPDLGSGGRPCRFKSCYPHFYYVASSSPLYSTEEDATYNDLKALLKAHSISNMLYTFYLRNRQCKPLFHHSLIRPSKPK